MNAPTTNAAWAVRCPKCLRTRPLRNSAGLTASAEGRKTAARCGRCGIVFAEVVRLPMGEAAPAGPDLVLDDGPDPRTRARRAAG